MTKILMGMTLLASISAFADGAPQVDKMNITCHSKLDAVCEEINGRGSYATSFECGEKNLDSEGTAMQVLGYNIKNLANRGLIKLGEALDPNCYGDQQQCGQDPSQGEVNPNGQYSEEFTTYTTSYNTSDGKKTFAKHKHTVYAGIYQDKNIEILSKITCEK